MGATGQKSGNIPEMQMRERSGAVRRHEDTGPRRGDFGSNRTGARLCCLLPVSSPTPLRMLHFIYCTSLFVRSLLSSALSLLAVSTTTTARASATEIHSAA